MALLAAARVAPRWRLPASTAVAVVLVVLAVLAGGVGDELLSPSGWGDLAAGIGRGVAAVPGVRVPYRGLDEWTRIVIQLGGIALIGVAALLAFWPRRTRSGYPAPALAALVALYATPVVALDLDSEFLRGALLAVLVLAFLRLEKLSVLEVPAAGALAGVVAVLALMVAPALDRDQPWWDYETWALSTAASKSTTFSWDHEYGPLDWPRDGRELLRVKAKLGAYWKADNLDVFDGQRWRHARLGDDSRAAPSSWLPDDYDSLRWTQAIKVSVRNLRSSTFVTAGTTVGVDMPGRHPRPADVATVWNPGRMLKRGDAYTARVYTPRPSPSQLRSAGTDYPAWAARYLTFGLPSGEARPVQVPAWGDDGATDERPIQSSSLGGVWELARRQRSAVASPYAYARSIESRLWRPSKPRSTTPGTRTN